MPSPVACRLSKANHNHITATAPHTRLVFLLCLLLSFSCPSPASSVPLACSLHSLHERQLHQLDRVYLSDDLTTEADTDTDAQTYSYSDLHCAQTVQRHTFTHLSQGSQPAVNSRRYPVIRLPQVAKDIRLSPHSHSPIKSRADGQACDEKKRGHFPFRVRPGTTATATGRQAKSRQA